MPNNPKTTARTRAVWTPSGYIKFEWRPDPACSICAGAGMAWQHRTYGDQQYHGQYFEDCDRCSAPPKEVTHAE